MSLTSTIVYQLISDIEQYGVTHYAMLSQDGSAYFTILRVDGSVQKRKDVDYVIVVTPVFTTYTSEKIGDVSFYQVYINPYTTQMTFTALADAVPLSYAINTSSVFVALHNQNLQLMFKAPYVSNQQIIPLKQSILNMFAFPTYIALLYDTMMVQLNYIPTDGTAFPQAFQVTLRGVYMRNELILLNYFDFNDTLVVLENNNPFLFLNNQAMRIGNTQPYLFNPMVSVPFQIVIGSTYNYTLDISTVDSSGIVARMTRVDGTKTLNLQGNDEITKAKALSYTVLSSVVPLARIGNIGYLLGGVSALNYATQPLPGQAGWAVVQLSNIFNSNITVTSASYALLYTTDKTSLTRYQTTTLYYRIDTTNQTLTVWQDPTLPSFLSYVQLNSGTISFQDVKQV
jgi:hypothetical protein